MIIVFERALLGRAVFKADERGSDDGPVEAATEKAGRRPEEDSVGVVDGLPAAIMWK